MKGPQRSTGADDVVGRMQQVASRLWSEGSFWHAGGLAWQSAAIRADDSRVHLLGSAGTPSGWAWTEGGTHLNLLVAAHDERGAHELVEAFLGCATDAAPLTADVPHRSAAAVQALRDVGFVVADAPFSVDMRLGARPAPPRPPIPTGFAVRPLAAGEETALVECHREAWDPHALPWPEQHRPHLAPEAASSFTEAAFAKIRAMWPYRGDLVIVAEAPDGHLAASCIAWLDDTNGAAEIEPLGVVPRYRGLGLGRAICLEAVNRVARLGGTQVTIHPRGDDRYPAARALYASCGFRTVARMLPLRRAATA